MHRWMATLIMIISITLVPTAGAYAYEETRKGLSSYLKRVDGDHRRINFEDDSMLQGHPDFHSVTNLMGYQSWQRRSANNESLLERRERDQRKKMGSRTMHSLEELTIRFRGEDKRFIQSLEECVESAHLFLNEALKTECDDIQSFLETRRLERIDNISKLSLEECREEAPKLYARFFARAPLCEEVLVDVLSYLEKEPWGLSGIYYSLARGRGAPALQEHLDLPKSERRNVTFMWDDEGAYMFDFVGFLQNNLRIECDYFRELQGLKIDIAKRQLKGGFQDASDRFFARWNRSKEIFQRSVDEQFKLYEDVQEGRVTLVDVREHMDRSWNEFTENLNSGPMNHESDHLSSLETGVLSDRKKAAAIELFNQAVDLMIVRVNGSLKLLEDSQDSYDRCQEIACNLYHKNLVHYGSNIAKWRAWWSQQDVSMECYETIYKHLKGPTSGFNQRNPIPLVNQEDIQEISENYRRFIEESQKRVPEEFEELLVTGHAERTEKLQEESIMIRGKSLEQLDKDREIVKRMLEADLIMMESILAEALIKGDASLRWINPW